MTSFSKQLERVAQTDDRVIDYEYLGGNEDAPHWLHLTEGCLSSLGTHICNGATVEECLEELRQVNHPEPQQTSETMGKKKAKRKSPDQKADGTQPSVVRRFSQPADWDRAFRDAAEAAGMSLSAWIGEACKKQLPRDVRKSLSERPGAHRPARE